MREPFDSQRVLLRGEVVEISEAGGEQLLTVSVGPHGIVAPAEELAETHLGERVRIEAEIRVLAVATELEDDPGRNRFPSAHARSRAAADVEEER